MENTTKEQTENNNWPYINFGDVISNKHGNKLIMKLPKMKLMFKDKNGVFKDENGVVANDEVSPYTISLSVKEDGSFDMSEFRKFDNALKDYIENLKIYDTSN